MSTPSEVESQLASLSDRQCEILYWLCHGLKRKDIAQSLSYSEAVVKAEIGQIYRTFEIDDASGVNDRERQKKLFETICPVHSRLIKDPKADCRNRGKTTAGEVDGAGVVVGAPAPGAEKNPEHESQGVEEEVISPGMGTVKWPSEEPARPLPVGPLTMDSNRLPWVIVAILSIVLAFTLCRSFSLGPNPGPSSIAGITSSVVTTVPSAAPTSAPPVIITVIVTATPAPLAPIPPVATVAPTGQVASPIIQTVIVTAAPTVPSATPPAFLNVAGKVPSDIPGMNLPLGTTIYSVVARGTKQRDVYAISVQAGIPLVMDANIGGCVNIDIFNPGTRSVQRGNLDRAYGILACRDWDDEYTPAIAGTYYLVVEATDTTYPYYLVVTQR